MMETVTKHSTTRSGLPGAQAKHSIKNQSQKLLTCVQTRSLLTV